MTGNSYFGADPAQISLLKQEQVPAVPAPPNPPLPAPGGDGGGGGGAQVGDELGSLVAAADDPSASPAPPLPLPCPSPAAALPLRRR